MAKKNVIKIDISGFDGLYRQIESLGGNAMTATTEALKNAFETIQDDTRDALDKSNLPAKGKLSTGKTKESLLRHADIEWNGFIGSVDVGFDFNKAGAGGYLITGTPRMTPDYELRRIYKQKKYRKEIYEMIRESVKDYLEDNFFE